MTFPFSWRAAWLAFSSLLLLSCTAKIASDAVVLMKSQAPPNYAVLPFANQTTGLGKGLYPEAPDVVREAVETALLKGGYRVIERGQLERVLAEVAFSNSGFTEADRIKVGQLASADLLVFGSVTRYLGGRGRALEIEFSIKAVEVQTGAIVWKGETKLIPRASLESDKRKMTGLMAQDLVNQISTAPTARQ
jgi:hypothetical protein